MTRVAIAVAVCMFTAHVAAQPSRTYEALLALFKEWRAFEEPPRVNGVPDYSPATNSLRLAELTRLQARLQAIDTSG